VAICHLSWRYINEIKCDASHFKSASTASLRGECVARSARFVGFSTRLQSLWNPCPAVIGCRPTDPIYLQRSRIETIIALPVLGSDEILVRLDPTANVAHLNGVAGLTDGAWDEPVDERHENEEVFEPAAVVFGPLEVELVAVDRW